MSSPTDIRILTTPQDLFSAAAEEFIAAANQAVKERNRFTVALSGGSTPKSLYNLLATNAKNTLPWDRMFFFFGDERHVPPDSPESNYRMADESMLSKVAVSPQNVFRVPAEDPDAEKAAAAYEKTLRNFFDVGAGQFPAFDLILLGMGPDGHTASLFPETVGLREQSRWVIANWVEKFKTHRITLTLPVINAAREVMFLISGMDKAAALKEVLEGSAPGEQYPSKMVRPESGKLVWLIDRAAASSLINQKGQ